jgi:hypothetical protein
MSDFWSAIVVVGVAMLAVIVIEMFERWREVVFPPRKPHEIERVRRIETSAIQEAQDAKERQRWEQVFPATKGPHGFAGQLDRRGDRRPVAAFPKSKVN